MTTIDDIKKWRQDLHQIPEIGFKEYKTTDYLVNELTKMGYQPEKILETGCIVYIDNHQKETIAFRSDIDALKLNEQNDVTYCSKHEGFMHGCGHDGHMSSLLGLAKKLKDNSDYPYNILLIFQPAEELSGGARSVIETGIFEKYNVKAIFGLHLMPDYPSGYICCKKGPLMAQSGELDITIHGKSAHAGKYQEGVDSIVIASELICDIQNIVSRLISPFDPVVIHIGKIRGGSIRNIVASKTSFEGTIRTYSEENFNKIDETIKAICRSKEETYGCSIEYKCKSYNPPILNDSNLYQAFKECVDKDNYLELEQPMMLAEDYSHFQKVVPGIFFFVGTKTDKYTSGLHTGTFNFEEEVLLKAVDLYYNIACNIKLGGK